MSKSQSRSEAAPAPKKSVELKDSQIDQVAGGKVVKNRDETLAAINRNV